MTGAAGAEELLLVEGDRVGAAEQPGVPAEEGLERRAARQAGDLRGARAHLQRGEQRCGAAGTVGPGGDRQVFYLIFHNLHFLESYSLGWYLLKYFIHINSYHNYEYIIVLIWD